MLPYIGATTFSLGPIPLQVWGTFVASGFLVGTWLAARRAKANGLDAAVIWDMAFWIFLAAMLGSRLFHVLVYEPSYYLAHPLEAFDPRKPGYAIYGGLGASVLVIWLYARKRGLDLIAYLDALVWGLPWGCGIGRIGCFLIHDHPGTLSDFALAVKYPDGKARHDLGLYLSLAGFAIGGIFLLAARKKRGPGFYLGLFLALDGGMRLWLDMYRVADARLFGLTPTQWLSLPLIGFGLWLMRRASHAMPKNAA